MNCSPPIRFYEPKVIIDESKPDDKVNLKVKADVNQPESSTNVSMMKFTTIKTFMLNDPLMANQRLKLDQDIFIPEGLMEVTDLDKRFARLKMLAQCLQRS